MTREDASLTERIEHVVRTKGAAAKQAIDGHVTAQGERLEHHLGTVRSRLQRLPGVRDDGEHGTPDRDGDDASAQTSE